MNDLALKIRQIDLIVIANGELPMPLAARYIAAGEPSPPGADDQGMRLEERFLALYPNLRQEDMPAVPQQLLVMHKGSSRSSHAVNRGEGKGYGEHSLRMSARRATGACEDSLVSRLARHSSSALTDGS